MPPATKTRTKPDERQQPPAERPPDPAAAPAPAPTQGQAAPEAPQVSDGEARRLHEAIEQITATLKRPFRPDQLGWKAQAKSNDGKKALAVPYVDARDVMNRLDEAVGIACWRDSYSVQADGSVLCRLELFLGLEWVGKEDVGGQSDQPDEGDRAKAAFSDALKRAAVKWGIARYLYYLPAYWVGYDGRNLTEVPNLPHWAMPPGAKAVAKSSESPPLEQAAPPAEPAAREQKQPAATPADFHRQLAQYDGKLAGDGLCAVGDLVKAVAAAGKRDGFPADMTTWDAAQIERARGVTKDFVEKANLRQDVDRLMAAKNARIGTLLDKVATRFELPASPSLMTLTAVQLRYAVARLEEMPDAGKDRKAS